MSLDDFMPWIACQCTYDPIQIECKDHFDVLKYSGPRTGYTTKLIDRAIMLMENARQYPVLIFSFNREHSVRLENRFCQILNDSGYSISRRSGTGIVFVDEDATYVFMSKQNFDRWIRGRGYDFFSDILTDNDVLDHECYISKRPPRWTRLR